MLNPVTNDIEIDINALEILAKDHYDAQYKPFMWNIGQIFWKNFSRATHEEFASWYHSLILKYLNAESMSLKVLLREKDKEIARLHADYNRLIEKYDAESDSY